MLPGTVLLSIRRWDLLPRMVSSWSWSSFSSSTSHTSTSLWTAAVTTDPPSSSSNCWCIHLLSSQKRGFGSGSGFTQDTVTYSMVYSIGSGSVFGIIKLQKEQESSLVNWKAYWYHKFKIAPFWHFFPREHLILPIHFSCCNKKVNLTFQLR